MIKKILNYFLQQRLKKICRISLNSHIIFPKKIINPFFDPLKITIGMKTIVKGELQVLGHGGEIHIGNCSYIGENSYIWSGKKIRIGNNVLIGHHCNIFDNDIHPIDDYLKRHWQYMEIISRGQPSNINLNDAEINIEDDVWIGANVTVLKNVTIGRGSVIGACSVVTKSIEPFSVYAGNPAKKIRQLREIQC